MEALSTGGGRRKNAAVAVPRGGLGALLLGFPVSSLRFSGAPQLRAVLVRFSFPLRPLCNCALSLDEALENGADSSGFFVGFFF